MFEDDWERMVTFYDFPEAHWQHLRTTNVIESPFASVRLRTTATKRFKQVESATALIWKLLTVAEKRFRKLNALGATPCCAGNIGLARCSVWGGNSGARLPNRLATSTSGATRWRSSRPASTTSSS